MIIEEVIINDVKIVLSRGKGGKGGKNNETYKFYIYIVNKDVSVYRVGKHSIVIWQHSIYTSDKSLIQEAQDLASAVFKYKTEKLKEVIL
ncbi:hypothetical protein [Klebsiella pneumoniae]|uniref:hypothetical protein n=1 Tax=Klebsiella pneumoniae TaxID=573 RepID=UPI003853DCE6